MARKAKKKELEDSSPVIDEDSIKMEDGISEEEPEIEEIAEQEGEDDITYTMGDIKVLGSDEEEKLDLKKINNNEDEDDEVWVDPEIIPEDDEHDPYLDEAYTFDSDNPYDND